MTVGAGTVALNIDHDAFLTVLSIKMKKKLFKNTKTHALLSTEMVKIDIPNMTKTEEKPYTLGPHVPILPI